MADADVPGGVKSGLDEGSKALAAFSATLPTLSRGMKLSAEQARQLNEAHGKVSTQMKGEIGLFQQLLAVQAKLIAGTTGKGAGDLLSGAGIGGAECQ